MVIGSNSYNQCVTFVDHVNIYEIVADNLVVITMAYIIGTCGTPDSYNLLFSGTNTPICVTLLPVSTVMCPPICVTGTLYYIENLGFFCSTSIPPAVAGGTGASAAATPSKVSVRSKLKFPTIPMSKNKKPPFTPEERRAQRFLKL